MQAIATEFRQGHYLHTQVERAGNIAIYTQTHTEVPVTRYEVIRIRVQPETTWPSGQVTPEREAYPGAGAWGRDGWTFFTREEARGHAQRLQDIPSSAPGEDARVDVEEAPGRP